MAEPFRYATLNEDGETSHVLVPRLVQPGSAVLEFGCATGYMSKLLSTRLGCTVTGVELFPEAAEQARAHCARVIVGDAEQLDYQSVLGGEKFDVVLFADVLEHLRDPGQILKQVRPLLRDGGAIVASVPNVAHGGVRLALLAGEFRYRPTGLLDDTHLRFFTRETVQDLFESAGYAITHWLRTREPIDGTELGLPARPLPPGILEWLAADPEATTYQFVVRAEPADVASVHRRQRDEARAEYDYAVRVYETAQDVTALVPDGATLILVDAGQMDERFAVGRRRVPFLERDGAYWGPPADGPTAIHELERLRGAGAEFVALLWTAFWWLDAYPEFGPHLRRNYRCLRDDEHLKLFDLRQPPD